MEGIFVFLAQVTFRKQIKSEIKNHVKGGLLQATAWKALSGIGEATSILGVTYAIEVWTQ